jgi:hypothetical protein
VWEGGTAAAGRRSYARAAVRALIFFSSWLARLIQLQREQAELTRRLLDRTPDPDPSSTQLIPVAD